MKTIQLHALPEDLFDLIATCAREFGMLIMAVREAGECVFISTDANVASQLQALLPLLEVRLLPRSGIGVTPKGLHAVIVEFGQRAGETLRESAVGTKSRDPKIEAVFRKMRALLKKLTLKGLWASNPCGDVAFYKDARYTARVRDECSRGLKLLAPAGDVVYSIDSPS